MAFIRIRATTLVFAALSLAACNDSNTTECGGSVSGALQDGTELHVGGQFNNGQPVLTLTKSGSPHILVASDYNNSGATFDLTGLAPGIYTATWEISCNEGGLKSLDGSKVPTVTVN